MIDYRIFKCQKGFALPTVIILFTVIIIISASALSMAVNQSNMNRRYIATVDAIHFAEAGLNDYLWHLNKVESESIAFKENINVGDGVYRVEHLGGSANDGFVNLRVTGFHKDSPDNIRTIEVTLSKRSFTQYVFLTDSDKNQAGQKIYNATIHTWEGPYHTNGNLYIWGAPTFNGRVTCGGIVETYTGGYYGGDGPPNYNQGEPQEGVEPIQFPNDNSELKGRALNSGHYYKGMTAIYLKGNKYDVRTYDTDTNEWKFNGKTYDELGISFGSEADPIPPGEDAPSLDLPENGVIYIDGTQGGQWQRDTGDLYITGEVNGKLTIATANNIYITGYDPTDWREPTENAGGSPRRTPQGTHTEGIAYAVGTEDESIFGLIAMNNIEILNMYWPKHHNENNKNAEQRWSLGSNNELRDVASHDLTIHGAYMALKGTIQYNPVNVNKGDVTMIGAMIQKNRGAFASGGTGYGRVFSHDHKLLYQTPPYFLEPTDSGWEINEWREVSDHVKLNN